MSAPGTIVDLIDFGDDDRAAILAPGREPLSFAALRALVRDTVAALNRLGDRSRRSGRHRAAQRA